MDVKLFAPGDLAKDKSLKDAVFQLCCDCDSEFVPALSSRESTRQTTFKAAAKREKPVEYFNNLIGQFNLLVLAGGGGAGPRSPLSFPTRQNPIIPPRP
jgi:hypothetical protein